MQVGNHLQIHAKLTRLVRRWGAVLPLRRVLLRHAAPNGQPYLYRYHSVCLSAERSWAGTVSPNCLCTEHSQFTGLGPSRSILKVLLSI